MQKDEIMQKIAIVTGANAGLGFETTKGLISKNYEVVMACRSLEKGNEAKDKIKKEFPNANIICMSLDLASLASVKKFSDEFKSHFRHLDLLINNAGIMMTPYHLTEDGFENQLATNYLGHFALTSHLFPLLEQSKNSRVVSLSSLAHKWGNIYFDDFHFKNKYDKKKAYGQSKLACLMFAYELNRKLKAAGSHVISVAAHPGLSATNLFDHLWLFKIGGKIICQSAKNGAKPTLFAALSNEIKGGEFCGPNGFRQFWGEATIVKSNKESNDLNIAKKLWEESEKMVGVKFL